MPTATARTYIRGLAPGATYDVTVSGRNVTVAAGTKYAADQAGVLAF